MKAKETLEKYYMYVTVFTTGAIVLVIEILGTRIIAPFYGTTIYVWCSLIGVTMLALAAGYFFGGILADRRPEPNMLYSIISAAAAFILIIPIISKYVIPGSNLLGPRFGALTSAVLLFSVPLILLGMVSPYAIKINEGKFGKIGTVAGSLYAVATAGSFAGAIITGFYLIPAIGINSIILVFSILLIIIASIGFMLNGKKNITLILPSIVICLLYFMPDIFISRTFGPNINILYEKQGVYGRIRAVEWKHIYRFIMIDGAVQTYFDMNKKEFNAPYIKMFEKAVDYRPGAKKVLSIGLGGGAINYLLSKRGIAVDTVEIDPDIVYVAKKYFDFSGNVITEDGRHYLHKTGQKYDMVFIDAFNGYSICPYLLSKETFIETKKVLNNTNGIIAINMMGYLFTDIDGNVSANRLVISLNKTLKQVFKNVYLKAGNKGLTSFVFYASDNAVRMDDQYINVTLGDTGKVLTDEDNPADFMASELIEKWRNYNISQLGAALFI